MNKQWLEFLRQHPDQLRAFVSWLDDAIASATREVDDATTWEATLAAKGKKRAFESVRNMVTADEKESAAYGRFTRARSSSAA